MPKKKPTQKASLTELTSHMLSSVMPTEDDPRNCLMTLGVPPTCAPSVMWSSAGWRAFHWKS